MTKLAVSRALFGQLLKGTQHVMMRAVNGGLLAESNSSVSKPPQFHLHPDFMIALASFLLLLRVALFFSTVLVLWFAEPNIKRGPVPFMCALFGPAT